MPIFASKFIECPYCFGKGYILGPITYTQNGDVIVGDQRKECEVCHGSAEIRIEINDKHM